MADLETRVEPLVLEELGPQGKWQKGLDWMKLGTVEEMIEQKVLVKGLDLKLTDDLKNEFESGLIIEKHLRNTNKGFTVIDDDQELSQPIKERIKKMTK